VESNCGVESTGVRLSGVKVVSIRMHKKQEKKSKCENIERDYIGNESQSG
jgi:hypothetical protein